MNINVDAKDIKETFKDFPIKPIMLMITVISSLLMFLPDSILKKLFLLDLRNKIGTYIGVVFLISICITVYLFSSSYIRKSRIKKEFSGRKAREKLEALSIEEKCILLYMFNNRSETMIFPCTNSAILHLKSLLMISYASSIGNQIGAVQVMPFFLQKWVVEAMNDNKDLFENVQTNLPYEITKYMDLVSI